MNGGEIALNASPETALSAPDDRTKSEVLTRPQLGGTRLWAVPGPEWLAAVGFGVVAAAVGALSLTIGVAGAALLAVGAADMAVLGVFLGGLGGLTSLTTAGMAVLAGVIGHGRVWGLGAASVVELEAQWGGVRVRVDGANAGWIPLDRERQAWVPEDVVGRIRELATAAEVRVQQPDYTLAEARWEALTPVSAAPLEPKHEWSHGELTVHLDHNTVVIVNGQCIRAEVGLWLYFVRGVKVTVSHGQPSLWVWDGVSGGPVLVERPFMTSDRTVHQLVWLAEQLEALRHQATPPDGGDATDVPDALRALTAQR